MFKKIDSKLKIEYGKNATFKFGKIFIIISILSIVTFLLLRIINVQPLSYEFYFHILIRGIMIYGIIQIQKYGLYLLYALLFYQFVMSLFGIVSPLESSTILPEMFLEDIANYPDEVLQQFNEIWKNSIIFGNIISILFNLSVIKYFYNKKKIFIKGE